MEIKELKPDKTMNCLKEACVFMQVVSNILINFGILGITQYVKFPLDFKGIGAQAIAHFKEHPELIVFFVLYNLAVIPLMIKLNHRLILKDDEGNTFVINN